MIIPWPAARCIVCKSQQRLSQEHLIPRAVSGRLSSRLLCKPCNDHLGQTEAALKSAPWVREAAEVLGATIPRVWERIAEGQVFVMKTASTRVLGTVKRGKFRVQSRRQADGSLIQPTVEAKETLERMLTKDGFPPAHIAAALKALETANDDKLIEVAPHISIIKRTVMTTHPAYDATEIDDIVPLKIAYEYLALHLGDPVFVAQLDSIRAALRIGKAAKGPYTIERMVCTNLAPFHRLVLEQQQPHIIVQLRLFGTIGYRVHFRNIFLKAGSPCAYTHDLAADREYLTHIPGGEWPS